MLFKFKVQIHDDIDKTFEFLGTEFDTEVPVDGTALLNMKQEVFDYVLGNNKLLLGDFSETVGTYLVVTEANFNYLYVPPPNEANILNIIWKDALSISKLD